MLLEICCVNSRDWRPPDFHDHGFINLPVDLRHIETISNRRFFQFPCTFHKSFLPQLQQLSSLAESMPLHHRDTTC